MTARKTAGWVRDLAVAVASYAAGALLVRLDRLRDRRRHDDDPGA